MPRYYTVVEANALLPALIPKLEELRDAAQQLAAVQQELARISPAGRRNGQADQALRLEAALRGLTRRADALLREFRQLDVEVKDPLTGLIDFLALRQGRDVYLCWRLGEGQIAWWHDLDAGFRGRQPL